VEIAKEVVIPQLMCDNFLLLFPHVEMWSYGTELSIRAAN